MASNYLLGLYRWWIGYNPRYKPCIKWDDHPSRTTSTAMVDMAWYGSVSVRASVNPVNVLQMNKWVFLGMLFYPFLARFILIHNHTIIVHGPTSKLISQQTYTQIKISPSWGERGIFCHYGDYGDWCSTHKPPFQPNKKPWNWENRSGLLTWTGSAH